MRPSANLWALLTATLLVGVPTSAADRTPSAIRARQIYGPTPGKVVRPVQDGGESGGPQLLGPTIESLPDSSDFQSGDSTPLDERPTPTFVEPPARSPAATGPVPFVPDRLGPSQSRPAPIPRIVGTAPSAPPESNDFWIVSSRNCVQQGNRPSVSCPLDYYRCERGGRRVAKDENAFRQSIPPGVPVCVVVHGSFTDWETVCEDAAATQRWLRRAAPHLPLQVVLFSWPSEPTTMLLPPVDTGIMGTRAEFNGLYLSQLIQRIPSESPVSLVGHSHGARSISSALHLMGGGMVQGYRYPNPQAFPHKVRVVYMAGALDHHWLDPGERYGRALARTDAILNVRNSQDWALAFYEWRRPFAGAALGKDGLYNDDRRRLGEMGGKIREIDVTRLLGTDHLWPSYVRRPEIASAAVPYIYFEGEVGGGAVRLAPNPGAAGAPVPNGSPTYGEGTPELGTPAGQPTFEQTPTDVSRYRPAPSGSASPQSDARFAPARGDPFRQPGPGQNPSMVRQPPLGTPASPAGNPYGAGRPAARPNSNPATLLPPQSSVAPRPTPTPGTVPLHPIDPSRTFPTRIDPPTVTKAAPPADAPPFRPRNGDGGSLEPIPPPATPGLTPEAGPNPDGTHPVHIDEPPRQTPRFRLPTIIRKYYPEASRDGTQDEI